MCWYMPNKPPCTCTFMQLIQPCAQIRLLPSPDGNPSPLIQICPIRHIARGVGQRFCLQCHGAAGIAPDMSAARLVGYPSQGHEQLCSEPQLQPKPQPPAQTQPQPQPHFQFRLRNLRPEEKNREVLRVATPLDPEILRGEFPAADPPLSSEDSGQCTLGQVADSGLVDGGQTIMEDGADKYSSPRPQWVRGSSDINHYEKNVLMDDGRVCGTVASCMAVSMICGFGNEDGERDALMDQAEIEKVV